MSEAIRRAAVLRRLNTDIVDVRDGDRFVFRYGAQGIHGLGPGTFGIFPSGDPPEPVVVIKCPACGQESQLAHNVDRDGRIEQEVICPTCGWTAFALLQAWRETWKRIVGD